MDEKLVRSLGMVPNFNALSLSDQIKELERAEDILLSTHKESDEVLEVWRFITDEIIKRQKELEKFEAKQRFLENFNLAMSKVRS